jgi:hypothetical protein
VGRKHTYLVPDEHGARGLAEAFAEFGFPLVLAAPYRPGRYFTDPDAGADDWDVTVFDTGPDSADERSEWERHTVEQAARALARDYGGFRRMAIGFAAGQAGVIADTRNAALVLERPGARPAPPAVSPPDTPAPAALPITVVKPVGTTIELDGLGDVRWPELSHAHGSAADVPGLIEALAEGFGTWAQVLDELIGDDILHQGSCYSATGPAMPFLTKLITSGALPFHQQMDVYEVLLYAATRHAAGLLSDADRAAARRRPLRPAEWSAEVYEAVGTCVPALLDRWALESEPARVEMAALAALFPGYGAAARGSFSAMAARYEDTDVGALLNLGLALIDGDAELAEQRARGLAIRPAAAVALNAPGLPIATRAAEFMATTASSTARHRRTET